MRVLVAEDDTGIRDLLLDVLGRQGHMVLSAGDGEEAWVLYKERGADLIVSDWLMPRMEGPELCLRVRAHDSPYTYFILLTALGDQQHHLRGRQSGVDDYLSKPFDFDDLQARMVTAERVVTLHRRREALLRVGRRVAIADDPAVLFSTLLDEAIELAKVEAGCAARFDSEDGTRAVVWRASRLSEEDGCDLVQRLDRLAIAGGHTDRHNGSGGTIEVPLRHEGQLLGVLALGTRDQQRTFSREETETLETMATLCAAGLAAIERARLEGVLLAARTAQHELNNRLGVVMGYAEMLAESPGLPDSLVELVDEIVRGAKELAETVDQLRRVTRIRETPRPSLTGPTLDLTESVA